MPQILPKAIRKPRPRIIIRTFEAFNDNDLTTSAAAVSYFTMLALFPTLLLLITIGNQVLGPKTVERFLLEQVMAFFPGAQKFVSSNLESITGSSTELTLSSLFVMLWAVSWMFTVIEKALNRIWGTRPRSFFHGRAVNLALMILVWAILGASAILTALVSGARAVTDRLGVASHPFAAQISGYAWSAVFIISSVSVTIILFTALYKLLPNAQVTLFEAIPGAVLAGVLWEGAKFGFSYLLPHFHYELLYGSIGAVVALLTWVYMSSGIMLLGAQFTALLHRDHLYEGGSRISEV